MKLIVTHLSVDLDAIASVWLIRRFLPGWDEAEYAFVPAGKTYQNKTPDADQDVIHTDTGVGRFDHHQTNTRTSATKLVLDFLLKKKHVKDKNREPLERMVDVINETDHFGEIDFPEPTADRYEFFLTQIIDGLKPILQDDLKTMNLVLVLLDGVFLEFKNKVQAEEEIKNGFVFTSYFGRSLVLESKNEEVVKLALKMGYRLVARRDPARRFIRIKTKPLKEIDLTAVYKKIIKMDPKATWFLHVSKHMLLNGSAKNPDAIASSLTLQQLIAILKDV
ncbi:chromate resistance protein [Candidatus Roizmanbacteria bacterium]|nr:chromate resistance protein [Candidatus Roizmanbacteria bacterium]